MTPTNPNYKQHERGDRLRPDPSNRVYFALGQLRRMVEETIADQKAALTGATLVDYGCGNMPYQPLFEAAGVEHYQGADLAGNSQAAITLNPDGTLPLTPASVDIILSIQVLEHVTDPALYLRECQRVLKPGGLLILSTHGTWIFHPDPLDLWRWTSMGLRKIVEEQGFEIQVFRGVTGLPATGLQLWQDALLPRLHWRLRQPFTWTMQKVIAFQDRRTPQADKDRDACVYLVIAHPRNQP